MGENLPSMSFLSTTAYYCVITAKHGEQQQTEETTPAEGSDAKFNHRAVFQDLSGITAITVALRDASDNAKLGIVEIPSQKFDTTQKKIKLEDWFDLAEEPGMSGAVQGRLKLSIERSPQDQ